eukprot:342337-Amorphochlora_amoeboformis.AAC.1
MNAIAKDATAKVDQVAVLREVASSAWSCRCNRGFIGLDTAVINLDCSGTGVWGTTPAIVSEAASADASQATSAVASQAPSAVTGQAASAVSVVGRATSVVGRERAMASLRMASNICR